MKFMNVSTLLILIGLMVCVCNCMSKEMSLEDYYKIEKEFLKTDLTPGSKENVVIKNGYKLKDYEVTIFQHFYILLDCYENKRSKEKSCELDFSQYRLLNSNFFEFDIQEQVKKKLKLKNYREKLLNLTKIENGVSITLQKIWQFLLPSKPRNY